MKAIYDNTRALDAAGELVAGGLTHAASVPSAIPGRVSKKVRSTHYRAGRAVPDAYPDYNRRRRHNFGRGWCQIRYMPRMSNYAAELAERGYVTLAPGVRDHCSPARALAGRIAGKCRSSTPSGTMKAIYDNTTIISLETCATADD